MTLLFKQHVYILIICLLPCLCFAAAETVYFDDFDGLATTPLHGTTPDIDNNGGGNTWIAHDSWMADGAAGDYSSATLPFTPVSGYLYQLTVTLQDVIGDSYWLAVGYGAGSSTAQGGNGDRFIGSPTTGQPWMLRRGNQATGTDTLFAGPGTLNSQKIDPLDRSQDVDFRIILDTRQTNWTARWYHKLTTQSDYQPIYSYQYDTNPTIASVGIACGESPDLITGRFDRFLLEKIQISLAITEDVYPQEVDINAFAGEAVAFNVKFTSDSSPTATWHHIANSQDTLVDGSDPEIDMILDNDSQTGVYTSTLSISNANSNHKGWYYCVLNNDDGYPVISSLAYLGAGSLVSYWPLEADEYTGGYYHDIAGDHNALATGTPAFVEGVSRIADTAVEVTGSTGWATSTDFILNPDATDFSISLWTRTNNNDTNKMMLITALSGTTDIGSMNDSAQPWQHLCITYDGLQGRIYRNGQKVYEEYWPEVDLGQLYAGIGYHDNGQFFNGAIDEIKLYKSALTDSEAVIPQLRFFASVSPCH